MNVYFLCRQLNNNAEHNLLVLPTFQKLYCIIRGSPETFLNHITNRGKIAYDSCYGMKSQRPTRTKQISWLIMFSHETQLTSILWNHQKGTKLSVKTEREYLEVIGGSKEEVVPTGWSTNVCMRSHHLLNYSLCSTYLSFTLLEVNWNLTSSHIATNIEPQNS